MFLLYLTCFQRIRMPTKSEIIKINKIIVTILFSIFNKEEIKKIIYILI